MEPVELTYGEYWMYFILAGAVLGALFGVVPLILGRIKNRKRLGFYGFLESILGGAATPLVSIVIVAVFTWLILKKGGSASSSS